MGLKKDKKYGLPVCQRLLNIYSSRELFLVLFFFFSSGSYLNFQSLQSFSSTSMFTAQNSKILCTWKSSLSHMAASENTCVQDWLSATAGNLGHSSLPDVNKHTERHIFSICLYARMYTQVTLYAYMYFCICKEVCMTVHTEISTPDLIKMYWTMLSLQAWIFTTWNCIFTHPVTQLKMVHEIIVH